MSARPGCASGNPNELGHDGGATVRRGRDAHPPLERLAQRGLRAVADALCDLGEARGRRSQERRRKLDAPLREILDRRHTDEMSEALGEDRTRHADLLGELFEAPGVRGAIVELLQRAANAWIAQAREPT